MNAFKDGVDTTFSGRMFHKLTLTTRYDYEKNIAVVILSALILNDGVALTVCSRDLRVLMVMLFPLYLRYNREGSS